jgi:hypothetical protein
MTSKLWRRLDSRVNLLDDGRGAVGARLSEVIDFARFEAQTDDGVPPAVLGLYDRARDGVVSC